MTKGIPNFHCRGICVHLEGYEKGYYHFHVEGKAYCGRCDYKILTDNLRCPCCSSKYRRSRRKDYPHLERGYRVPPILIAVVKKQ